MNNYGVNLIDILAETEPLLLCRYEQLWKSKGYSCQLITPSMAETMIPALSDARSQSRHNLLEAECSYNNQKYIVHVFSNGGFLALTQLLMLSHSSSRLLTTSVHAVIFDSAPCLITSDVAARCDGVP